MPRSGAAARARLREAALDLFEQRGYEVTTTAEISAAAGVTERTFFRHFADKREVLFDGESELRDTMTAAVAASPVDAGPTALVRRAYAAAIPLLVAGRPEALRRAGVIATSRALRERADAKASALTAALADALSERGVPAPTARLSAHLGAAVFERAHSEWGGASATELAELLMTAESEAHALLHAATRTTRRG